MTSFFTLTRSAELRRDFPIVFFLERIFRDAQNAFSEPKYSIIQFFTYISRPPLRAS